MAGWQRAVSPPRGFGGAWGLTASPRLGEKGRMTRCIIRWISLFCFLVMGLSAAEGAGRPNIIFLLADDMRWDAAGFAGNEVIETPNLDQLAREGTVFREAFVTTAICAVSRASIFAGQYACRTGIDDFATPFSDEAWAETYPALLKRAGYRTGFIGKFGVGRAAPTNTFEYWDGFNGQGRYFSRKGGIHLTRAMGESALTFLASRDERPFCLSISFKAPHVQDGRLEREFPPDPEDEALYEGVEMPAAETVSEAAFEELPEFLRRSEGRNRWTNRFATPEMRARSVRDYYRLVTGIDREVGLLRRALRDLGLAANTVIIFSSDNGFFLGEHGLAGKWFMYEESIRVPLLVHAPGLKQARESRGLALNIDIAPTILDLAGLEIPKGMQGRSLRPLLTGRDEGWREDFFYEHHFPYGGRIPDSEGVRGERWKYVRYTGVNPVVEQLFDLKADPLEQEDLAARTEHQRRLERMRERWRELRAMLE